MCFPRHVTGRGCMHRDAAQGSGRLSPGQAADLWGQAALQSILGQLQAGQRCHGGQGGAIQGLQLVVTEVQGEQCARACQAGRQPLDPVVRCRHLKTGHGLTA